MPSFPLCPIAVWLSIEVIGLVSGGAGGSRSQVLSITSFDTLTSLHCGVQDSIQGHLWEHRTSLALLSTPKGHGGRCRMSSGAANLKAAAHKDADFSPNTLSLKTVKKIVHKPVFF